MVWDQKVQSLDWVAPDQLLANPRNARRHPAGQREALREMIGKVGFVAPLIVNSVTGMLLDGHARVEEALSAGVELLPVVTVELAEGDEAAFLAGFDAVGMLARWDQGLLGELVGEAQFDDGELLAALVGAQQHQLTGHGPKGMTEFEEVSIPEGNACPKCGYVL